MPIGRLRIHAIRVRCAPPARTLLLAYGSTVARWDSSAAMGSIGRVPAARHVVAPLFAPAAHAAQRVAAPHTDGRAPVRLTAVLSWVQASADGHPVQRVSVDACPSPARWAAASYPCINAKPVQPYYTSDLWLLTLCRSACGTIAARVVVTSHNALLPSTY